ncbi:MAG TPA: hypothetical protein VNM66_01020 [Thermodesulfobacteriota bacterium]|nr:hypothetical protein [Thermodesulfobacteriota bacterium]
MKRPRETLVVLFTLGVLLFNFPVLAIFNQPQALFGIPVLYLYLFGVWAAVIAVVWALTRRRWDD